MRGGGCELTLTLTLTLPTLPLYLILILRILTNPTTTTTNLNPYPIPIPALPNPNPNPNPNRGGGEASTTNDHTKHLALLCLGEVGKEVDLADQRDQIKDVVLESFRQGTEETKSAASFAFGRMVVGNMVLLQVKGVSRLAG